MTNEAATIETASGLLGWYARIDGRSRALGPYPTESLAIAGAVESIAFRRSLDNAIAD